MPANPFSFLKDLSGGVAIIFALALPILIGGIAAAVDYSYAASRRAHLQAAADAAALSGAKSLAETADSAAATANAQNFFKANAGFDVTPNVTVGTDTVAIEAHYSYPGFLTGIFGQKQMGVRVRAVARAGAPNIPCVLTLENTEKHGIYLNSDSKLDTDCAVQVNSQSSEALFANSNSDLNSSETCVGGGWTTNSGSSLKPTPKKCAKVTDPLASLPTPAEATGPCKHTDFKVDAKTVTLSPGVYCKTTELNSGAVATLNPGIYVFRDGLFKINSGSKAKGNGVLLFFTGSGTRLEVDSLSTLEASAPTSGVYNNVVIYQDRKTTSDFFILNSDGNSKLEGIIYIPNSPLKLNSQSAMTNAPSYFGLIVRRLELNSGAKILIRNQKSSVATASKGVTLVK